ncbi:MAG: hypothetical protein JNK90_30070 [Planctomycetaceae bacterium]|nr:hypothetical protein [Planctomycetaceae bacterium]
MNSTNRPESFKKSVSRCVQDILEEAGFRSCEKYFSTSTMISYLKPCSNELAFYLFYHDKRSSGGFTDVELWLAPIQLPDSGISKLGYGIMLDLSQGQKTDDETLKGITRKACSCLPLLRQFEAFVLAEMMSPFFTNRRAKFVQYELDIERTVRDKADLASRPDEIGKSYRDRKSNLGEVAEKCTEILEGIGDEWIGDLRELDLKTKGLLLAYICAAKAIAID